MNKEIIQNLNLRFEKKPTEEILEYFLSEYKNKIVFSSSMGLEDQVITDMLMKIDNSFQIFTLDTGRLYQETYDLINKTNIRYKTKIKVFFPDAGEVEEMVNQKGINLFYESVENRKQCCYIRKIKPFQRALAGNEIWISGLRKEQSVTRTEMQLIEWDETNKMIKINPLIDWTSDDVWIYIKKYGIPYNPMHDNNFPSIGCQPCTRAILPGEHIRAGRWWWEQLENRECGLNRK
jgi:phosphoadenosine phosphosulfate reductase